MGLLLKLHLSSYVARKTQEFSITANVIVLFLLWLIKDVILICLMTTLHQSMYVNSKCKHEHIGHFFTCLGTKASSADILLHASTLGSLPVLITHP